MLESKPNTLQDLRADLQPTEDLQAIDGIPFVALDVNNVLLDLSVDEGEQAPLKHSNFLIPILQYLQAKQIPICFVTPKSRADEEDEFSNTNGKVSVFQLANFLYNAYKIKIPYIVFSDGLYEFKTEQYESDFHLLFLRSKINNHPTLKLNLPGQGNLAEKFLTGKNLELMLLTQLLYQQEALGISTENLNDNDFISNFTSGINTLLGKLQANQTMQRILYLSSDEALTTAAHETLHIRIIKTTEENDYHRNYLMDFAKLTGLWDEYNSASEGYRIAFQQAIDDSFLDTRFDGITDNQYVNFSLANQGLDTWDIDYLAYNAANCKAVRKKLFVGFEETLAIGFEANQHHTANSSLITTEEGRHHQSYGAILPKEEQTPSRTKKEIILLNGERVWYGVWSVSGYALGQYIVTTGIKDGDLMSDDEALARFLRQGSPIILSIFGFLICISTTEIGKYEIKKHGYCNSYQPLLAPTTTVKKPSYWLTAAEKLWYGTWAVGGYALGQFTVTELVSSNHINDSGEESIVARQTIPLASSAVGLMIGIGIKKGVVSIAKNCCGFFGSGRPRDERVVEDPRADDQHHLLMHD